MKRKIIPIMEKDALNMPCLGCIVEHFVRMFILICKAFGNLDFLDLLCGTFIFNVYKKKHHLRNFSKTKGWSFCGRKFCIILFCDSWPYSQKLTPEKNKKYALFTKNATIFKENLQKMDIIHKSLFCKIQCLWGTKW